MSTLCLGGPLERFRVFARAANAAFQNDYWYIRYMYLEHFEQIREGINLIEHLIIHVVISFWSNSRNHREWRWNQRRYEFQYFNSTVHWLSVIQDTILASKNKQTIEQGYYTNRISKIWFFKKLNWQGLACPQNIWGILHHISEIFYLKKAHSIPYRQTTGLGGTRIIASDWEEIVNPPRLTKPTYCSLPTGERKKDNHQTWSYQVEVSALLMDLVTNVWKYHLGPGRYDNKSFAWLHFWQPRFSERAVHAVCFIKDRQRSGLNLDLYQNEW